MPKSTDSFFLRFGSIATSVGFTQVAVDLGAFVDALGQSVLRIHNCSVQFTDENNINNALSVNATSVAHSMWQITTQSQDSLIRQNDKSVVATGSLVGMNTSANPGMDSLTDSANLNPMDFTNGYLVAVEQLYFGTEQNGNWASGPQNVDVVLECTVEKLSKEAALALALSQQ
tara:strand:- start:1178 stop:1696 length:519 start_codon:yes stop_codon:yes gene_type:complete